MQHCNWVVKSTEAKRKDVMDYIKKEYDILSDEYHIKIHEVRNMGSEQLHDVWIFIPDSYKTNKPNLGTA